MKVIAYLKSHWVIISAILALGILEYFQISLTANNYIQINELKKKAEDDFSILNNYMRDAELTVNSRIDIIDSAIKADEKQQILFKKTRNAIKENTASNPNIRVLNKITLLVIKYAQNYNLSIADILAQMRQESDFKQEAVSHAGAIGVLQVMPDTFKYVSSMMGRGGLNIFNIDDNMNVGCYYMAEQLHEFGNFEDALRAYNAGPNWVKKVKAGENKEYSKETVNYVEVVLKWRETFKQYGLE